MQNFVDEKDATWGIRIDRSMLRKVKQDTGVLLTDLWLDDMALYSQICNDPLLAEDLLWSTCEEQAKSRSVNKEDFSKATDGDSFEFGVKALVQAIVDFFPPARREAMKTIIATGEEVEKQSREMLDLQMKASLLEVESERARLVSMINSAGSLESTETEKP